MAVRLSIVVPFHRDLVSLERCLAALDHRPCTAEVIIASDGALEDCHAVASAHGARVIEIPGPSGPAAARNAAARISSGDVLVFVDADVVVSRGALEQIAARFADEPEMSAIFGAYDHDPADAGFFSQYKNLAHSYVHQTASTAARTFWAGLGAVRCQAFFEVGGFDERFRRPSVEDIDLGYRLSAAGHRIVLDPMLTASHLKRWTFRSMIHSDVFDRGIPWTQLLLRYGALDNDLNIGHGYRACIVLAYLAIAALALGSVDRRFLAVAVVAFAGLAALRSRYYLFFGRRRGYWFAVRVFPVHVLHHLYNGLSVAVGTALFLVSRHLRWKPPAALPVDAWRHSGP